MRCLYVCKEMGLMDWVRCVVVDGSCCSLWWKCGGVVILGLQGL